MPKKIPDSIQDFFDEDQIPLVLSDAKMDDNPLISINPAFCRMSGFTASDCLGQNCRFMHGAGTQESSRNIMRGDFASKRDTSVLIRNYRKTGEPFDNFLYIFGIYDHEDEMGFRLGAQFPIPKRNRAESFERHTKILLEGLRKINASGDLPRHRLIDLEPVEALSASSLLFARLRCLKAA
ncbi:MAG: PAS domain-containing protein [Pseudomonadota bacterium]